MKVAILGAGMAGLLAAKALAENSVEYTLFDKNLHEGASNNPGLHYLHDSCGLPLEPKIVFNYVIGCKEGELPHEQYSRKLGTPLNNSLVDLPAYSVVYDFQEAYNILLHRYGKKVQHLEIVPSMVESLLERYDKIISTIPLPALFPEAKCEYVEVQAVKGRPFSIPTLPGDNQVVYNIDENVNWYRYSRVFGVEWTEVKQGGDFTIKKVVDTNFRSPDDRIILLGRWGSWNRKFLAHHSYYETLRRLSKW